MASISKRGEEYLAEIKITIDFKLHRESKTFRTKGEAQMWAIEREQELRAGRNIDLEKNKTLKDALIRYRDEVSPQKKGQQWEVVRINAWLKNENFPYRYKLESLTTDTFGNYRNSRDVSASTKNREMALLRAVIDICRREWKWMTHNPLTDLKDLKAPPPRNRRISEAEIQLIINKLKFSETETPKLKKQIIAVAFLVAIETAMRIGEILALDWLQVNLKQRYCSLIDTKNDDRRDVPLSKRAVELFQLMDEQRQGRVFNIKNTSLDSMFRQAVIDCGIQDLTFHDTRHEACTRLAQKLHILDLARTTGHRDTKSLMIYYNPTAAELASRLD